MIQTFTQQFFKLVPLLLVVAGLLAYNFMSAQWQSPTATAPNNNTEAPINISSNYQAKLGDLGAIRMRAGQYCNADGTVCVDGESLGGNSLNLPVCSNGQTLVADATGSWTCGAATTPPTTVWLVNSQHSESQCTALSGTVLTDGTGNKYCRFTASSCPSGWAKYQNWAAYRITTSACGNSSCTSPARAWSNTAGAPSQSTSCKGINGSDTYTPFTCSSAMNQVGCY